jgi:CheY-like chemotaxis protein
MFRILLVEDEPDALEVLARILRMAFTGAQIDTAMAVDEALALIRQAAAERRPYQVAILDFKLPSSLGEAESIDESLCYEVRDKMREALVIHITGHVGDEKVLRHLKDVHIDPRDPRAALISKLDIDSANHLVRKMKAYLYGTLIEGQINRLFGQQGGGTEAGTDAATSGASRGKRDITHELTSLYRNIVAHWDDLEDDLKQEIQKQFDVDTNSKPVRIERR